jgi:exopolysaccharide production protein ExoQ
MRPDENRIGMAEILCAGILAFFAMQGAIPGIAPNQANEMTNTAATTLTKVAGIGSQVVVGGMIAVLVVHQWRRLYRLRFALQWTAALAALAVLSTPWSQDPVITARRSIPFVLATLFGLYFGTRFSIRKQTTIFYITMAIAALASVVLAVFFPAIGLEASTGHFGNWQGIFTQKNACGRAMVFAMAAVLAHGRLNPVRTVGLLLFGFVLVMSGSRGAWIIATAVLLMYVLLRVVEKFTYSGRFMLLSAVIVFTLAAAVTAWTYFPLLAAFVGRDATLTGRTAIWQQVWIAILKHPLLGYGFSAFWQGFRGESYNVILALRFVLFHAHNGFLEIWLELGAVGLLLFTLSYVRAWRKLWPFLLKRDLREYAWMFFVLVLVALYDIDENSLLTFNGLFWVLYVAAIADIEILAAEGHMLQVLPGLNPFPVQAEATFPR